MESEYNPYQQSFGRKLPVPFPQSYIYEPTHQFPLQEDHGLAIFINHKPYFIKMSNVTAEDIRQLSYPPIPDDHDIFHVIQGVERVKMGATKIIMVDMNGHGCHFESVLNPSAQAALQEHIAIRAYYKFLNHGRQYGHDVKDWNEAEVECMVKYL